MKNIYFLGYKSDEFDCIQTKLEIELNDYHLLVTTGSNINVKEFIRIKLKAVKECIDYFILDVSVLQNTDYTTVLSFKSNIADKYPDLSGFLVIARQSDGLSAEEYNDIIRNSVNGKNYTLISDSLVDDMCENIVKYIREQDKKEELRFGKENKFFDGSEEPIRKIEKISDNDSVRELNYKNQKGKQDDGKQVKERESHRKEAEEEEKGDGIYFSYNKKLSDEALLVSEEIGGYHYNASDKSVRSIVSVKKEKNWSSKDNTILVFGVKKGIGTTFVAMNLALALAKEGAVTSYVQLSKLPDLDEKAKDYAMIRIGGYYEYNKVFFVKNAFLDNMNYHVVDLENDYFKLKKAVELGWLNNKQLLVVGQGSTSGLRELDACISKLCDITEDFNIMIVNPILNEECYENYEQFGSVYYFEHIKEPGDKKNSYNLSMIVDELYETSLEKQ